MSLTISHPATNTAAPAPALRAAIAPSLRPAVGFWLLIAMLALAASGKMLLHDTLDPDLFWHLRVAQRISALRFPGPMTDDLSFASIRTPWTPYSWLAELGMQWVWVHGGFQAALAVQLLTAAVSVLFIAASAKELTVAAFGAPRYFAAAVATLVAEFLGLPYWSFRPVTFALTFLAVVAWILQRDRRKGERSGAVWLLVPTTALFINFHFYAALVPAFVFALAAGAWWERRTALHTRPEANRRLRRYLMLALATSAACLATPMLPGMIQTVLHYQFGDVMVSSDKVAEFVPFYRAGPLAPIAAAFVVLILALAIARRRLLRPGDLLWLVMCLALLLRLGRFSPVFALFAAPALAVVLPRLSDKILTRPLVCGLLAIALSINAYEITVAFPRADMTLAHWLNRLSGDDGYPSAAADFIESHVQPRTHHLLNEFTWGGYLEWRLGDSYQVLLDGRTQLFTPAFWNGVYLGDKSRRKDFLAQFTADAALLPREHSALHDDLLHLGWTVAYQDDRAQVLLPPPAEPAKPITEDAGNAAEPAHPANRPS